MAMLHSCLHSPSTTAVWLCPSNMAMTDSVATCRNSAAAVRCAAIEKNAKSLQMSRREAMAASTLFWLPNNGMALASPSGLVPPGPAVAKLCDADCEEQLENIPRTTTASGLQYKDIVVGSGGSPHGGFQSQVAANYMAMIPNGNVFDSSLEKGAPYIFRVGTEQVIKGLDEGILSMKAGGKRRLYIPGEVAFPSGLGAAARRPSGPVVFDICLIYIPGISNLYV